MLEGATKGMEGCESGTFCKSGVYLCVGQHFPWRAAVYAIWASIIRNTSWKHMLMMPGMRALKGMSIFFCRLGLDG